MAQAGGLVQCPPSAVAVHQCCDYSYVYVLIVEGHKSHTK